MQSKKKIFEKMKEAQREIDRLICKAEMDSKRDIIEVQK